MSAIPLQRWMFQTTGAQKEPVRLSYALGAGAQFLEGDIVTITPVSAAPQSNGTVLAPPTSIDATIANSGGSIAAGTYYATITYINANGETTQGPVEAFTTTGTGLLTVQSPPPNGDATGYRLYLGTAAASASLFRSGATVAIGTAATASTIPSTNPVPTTNTTGLAAPSAPALAAGSTGGPPARTEYYVVTYVNENGETVGSAESSQALTAGQIVTVTAPAVSGDATGYNVYASVVSGQEVKQNAAPIALGTNWVEPLTGLILPGVQRAVANQAPQVNGIPCILGVADHDYNATYGGPVGGTQTSSISDPFGRPTFNQTVFGVTEYFPTGIQAEAKNVHVIAASSGNFVASLLQAWDPGYQDAQAGIAIDATTGIMTVDLTASNKLVSIVRLAGFVSGGGPGDTGARVVVKFLGTAAVPN